MKIAIMTQPLGKNYGGILQAWALQQILKRLGHEPVTIDRQPNAKGPAYRVARFSYRTLQKALGKTTRADQSRALPADYFAAHPNFYSA